MGCGDDSMMRPFYLIVSSLTFLFLVPSGLSREPVSTVSSRRINRVVALTSLSADLVMTLDSEILVFKRLRLALSESSKNCGSNVS